MGVHTRSAASSKVAHQEPFSRVAPLLGAALLLGTGGGFVLATILTLTEALHVPLGTWWSSATLWLGRIIYPGCSIPFSPPPTWGTSGYRLACSLDAWSAGDRAAVPRI
jgi:hypothetical protein